MAFCMNCGAAAEPSQRFCQSCGQALDPAAAAPQQQPVPDQPTTQQPVGGWTEETTPLPPTNPEDYQYVGGPGAPFGAETPTGGGSAARGIAKALAVVAVVAALAGGAFLAYTVFFDKTGAKSPEAAVTKLIEAIADQDGVEALRMLNPGETDGFGDVYEALQKKVADAGLASDADGAVLEAVKIELKNLEVEVEEKGDNAARVHIKDGNLKVTIDQSKLPDDYQDLYDGLDQDVLDELEDIDISEVLDDALSSDDEVFLTTIKQDGRWYVSPAATIGEYILEDEDLGELTAADFDKVADENAPKPKTSKDPEGALSVLVEAISSDSVEEIFAALPKDEVAALRPFTDVLQEQLDDSDGADLSLSDLDTDFKELDDDLGRLTINRGTVEGTIDGDDGFATLDGLCVTSTEEREREIYDPYTDDYDYETYEEEVEDCLPDEVRDETGIDAIWVILRKEDGGWQVDPRATLIDYATRAIENIDESTLRDALDFASYEDDYEDEAEGYEDY